MADDGNTRKRRKYIAKACNECKRRKIRCNGESPCLRCGRQRIECRYVEVRSEGGSEEIQGMDRLCERVSAMQEQIATLSAAVHALASRATRPESTTTAAQRPFRALSTAKESFQGPTTSAFGFDLAKSSLQRRGIVERIEAGEEGDIIQEPSPLSSPASLGHGRRGDPLWRIRKDEALRLCRVYEEEMGIMYPVLELGELLRQVEVLYGKGSGSPLKAQLGDGDTEGIDGDDVHILRLVFACALTAEASGSSELAMGLFESVREEANHCVWGRPDIKSIIFMTLLSIFYFQMDEETLAWRTIGIVERMCLEKGLHRRETLDQPAVVAAGRDRVLRLFWSIYILDMRWSFGTGMPFALEDTDIDPWLPEPEEKIPYLRVMIRYSRIAAKVWKFISAFNNNNTNEIKKEEMNYLDWQVLRWMDSMPDSLCIDRPLAPGEVETRALRRLRSLLYLRSNQLRMLIYRPLLHSASHIMRYQSESETVVDIAKDTIRFITRLNETSDIYKLQQVAFNWFLVSALAVLFLAVAQTPTQFSTSCKEEFYMALELVKGFSTRSYISRRLWTSIQSLRKLGPELGLHTQRHEEPTQETFDALDSSVVGSLDLASSSLHSQTPLNGAQMTRELMEWFEAVGNLETQIMGVGPQGFEQASWPDERGSQYMVDYGGELSSVMKDCF